MKVCMVLLFLAPFLAGCQQPVEAPPFEPPTEIALVKVADGFDQPVVVLELDGLLVGERAGIIKHNGDTWADLSDRIGSSSSEQGLLGIAMMEEAIVVSYTDLDGKSVLSRYPLQGGAFVDDETILMTVDQPFSNHNGGHVAFGPDGMLYWGLGDGGLAGDPGQNGQNPETLLGSILRLEVGPTGPAKIPSDNPFVGEPGRDEIWHYGLRNPWRFTFGEAMWIGDVGQNAFEEVNRIALDGGGANFGWNIYEGNHHFPSGATVTSAPGFVFPVAEYATGDDGCSVVMGPEMDWPGYERRAVYSDFCSGTFWTVGPDGDVGILLESDLRVSSFGGASEILVCDFGAGAIWRLQNA